MTISLSGSHRAGKTTLAKSFCEKHEWTFLETSASAIFKEMGYDPSVTYDFDTRMDIQEEILVRFDKFYAERSCQTGVTDRSPIDLIAYALADVQGDTLSGTQEGRLQRYVDACFAVLNKRFSMVLIVQPGIPLVRAEGKAAMSKGYMEHLNTLCMGLAVDERMKVPHFYIPRYMTNPAERMAALEFAVNRVRDRVQKDRSEVSNNMLH